MGLDTIAYKEFRNGEHIEADNEWFAGTEGLVRGCMGETNWIRGKYYNHLIEALSNVSLYQESIANDTVKHILSVLQDFQENPFKYRDEVFNHSVNPKELETLIQWFKIASERGCYLRGWW